MAWVPYVKWKAAQFSSTSVDFTTDTLNILLLDSSYTYSTAHDFRDDLSTATQEVAGTNYATKTIATPTVTSTASTVTIDASDPSAYSYHASGFSNARYAILYKDTGSAATSALIAYYDFTTDKGNDAGTLTLQLDSSGIFVVS
jgi:hypothetical protein